MKKINIHFFLYLIIVFNIFYFFIGFIFQHDFSNGGKIDFQHIYKNFLLFKESSILKLDWTKYESSSLPLFYIFTKYIIPLDNIFIFKLFGFVISLACLFLFYFTLKFKLKLNEFNLNILLISSILFISSSFRTDAFFGLEENIGFFFLLVSLIFFYMYQNNPLNKYRALAIFFSCLVFYTRQTYAFVPIITYLFFLDKNTIFSKKNFKLSFNYFIFLIPSLFFFNAWNSFVPPLASNRIVDFDFNTIASTFGMYIIFILPFYLLNSKDYLKSLKFKNYFFYSIFFILYAIVFSDLSPKEFGGGPLAKLMAINTNFKIIYLFFSFLGFLMTIDLAKKNINFLIFSIFFIFVYLFGDNSFFSYLDPLFLISIIIFTDNFNKKIKEDSLFVIYIFLYFLLLHLSWIYYFEVYLDGIIR